METVRSMCRATETSERVAASSRTECLHLDRHIRDIEREEKYVQRAVKEAAKRNHMSSAKAGIIEEMVNDYVDSALVSEETEEEVDKVLTAIAGKTVAQLTQAVRKERLKQPAQSVEYAEEEGADDEEELEEIRARLAKVRS